MLSPTIKMTPMLCLRWKVDYNDCGLKTSVLRTQETEPRIAEIKIHQPFLSLHTDTFPSSFLQLTPANPKVLVAFDAISKVNVHVKSLPHDWHTRVNPKYSGLTL
jgi:hypothetical protein